MVETLKTDRFEGHVMISNTGMCSVFVVWGIICALVVATAPYPASAAMKEVLCIVLDMVTGNVASALATIGIAIVGVAALMGKASWGLALTVGVGIGVMFGAVGIVDTLGLGYADCS